MRFNNLHSGAFALSYVVALMPYNLFIATVCYSCLLFQVEFFLNNFGLYLCVVLQILLFSISVQLFVICGSALFSKFKYGAMLGNNVFLMPLIFILTFYDSPFVLYFFYWLPHIPLTVVMNQSALKIKSYILT